VGQLLDWDSLTSALPGWDKNIPNLAVLPTELLGQDSSSVFLFIWHPGCQLCFCIHELLSFQIIMENLAVRFLGWD
jgi:hypothetical protein